MKSTVFHEQRHRANGDGYIGEEKLPKYDHALIYAAQIQQQDFLTGTRHYQIGILESFIEYLKGAISIGLRQDSEIIDILNQVNPKIKSIGFRIIFQPSNTSNPDDFEISLRKI